MRKTSIIRNITLLIGFDAFTKWLFGGEFQSFCTVCESNYEYFPIFGDWIGIQLSYNTGIAFSIPIEWILLKIITVVILLGLAYFYIREEYPKNSRLLDFWYTLIFAWAISHAYERIFVWHVVDFIFVKYFAILNFADIFISVGAGILIFTYVYLSRNKS